VVNIIFGLPSFRTYYLVKLEERVHGESEKSNKKYRQLDWFCGAAIAIITLIYISVFVLMIIEKETNANWDFE
jgi:hypothetical protein